MGGSSSSNFTSTNALSVTQIQDWSRTLKFKPKAIFCPTSIEELQGILVKNPGPFSVLGSLHSSSGIFENVNVIDTKFMPLTFSLSTDYSTFTASTNMTIGEVLLRLAVVGKALPATGGINKQTLAGLLGTNTSPPSSTVSMYSGLTSVKIVTIQGEGQDQKAVAQDINRDNPMFKALVANLGVVGVLVEATFETVPNQYYHAIQQIGHVDQLLKDLKFVDKDGNDYPFWRIGWFPKHDKGLVWAARPINTTNTPDGDYLHEHTAKILNKSALLEHTSPFLTVPLQVVYNAAILDYEVDPRKVEGPMRNILPDDRLIDNLFCTLAGFVFLPQDAPRAREIFKDYFASHDWPNLPVQTELVKVDDYFMSQWNFQQIDPTATYLVKFNVQYLTAPALDAKHLDKFRQQILNHLQGLWDELIKQGLKFKGHWGKVNFISPDDVQQLYEWNKYKGYVHKKFLNPYLSKTLPSLDS